MVSQLISCAGIIIDVPNLPKDCQVPLLDSLPLSGVPLWTSDLIKHSTSVF